MQTPCGRFGRNRRRTVFIDNMLNRQTKLGVVFDLDGTLVNSMPMVVAGFHYAVKAFGMNPTSEEVVARLGGPADVCLRNLLGEDRNLPQAMDRLIRYNEENQDSIEPFEGAEALLGQLLKARTKVALWTGRDRETTSEILSRMNWWPYFQTVVCGDDFKTHKPDPEGLTHIMDELSLASSEVLFVGDADVDVLAGHAVNVPTLLIRNDRNVSDHIKRISREWVETPQHAYDIIAAKVLTETPAVRGE